MNNGILFRWISVEQDGAGSTGQPGERATMMNYDNPFPGMNPYLEQPRLWPEVHSELIALLWSSMAAQMPAGYRLAIEERLEIWEALSADDRPRFAVPDLSISERREGQSEVALQERIPEGGIMVMTPLPTRVTYLEVRAASGQVVTVMEVLSPTNKAPGRGRMDYLSKRTDLLASEINLVEIDLLRAGEPMPLATSVPDCHYRILVSRERQRPRALLFPFMVQNVIPKFPLPLRPDDDELTVDLGGLLAQMHCMSRYNSFLDYDNPPPGPALDAKTLRWVDERLAALRRPA